LIPVAEYERIWQMICFDSGLRTFILERLAEKLEGEIDALIDKTENEPKRVN